MEELAIQWQPIVVASVMMILDIVTGFAGAVKNQTVESGKMREGLWHKAGFFGLIALAFIYEVAAVWMNFEADAVGLGATIPELPAVSGACIFIVATEIVSVCENLCTLNPHIAALPVIKSLKPHDPAAPDLIVEVEEDHATGAEG